MALFIFLLICLLAAACFLMGIYCERDYLGPDRARKVIEDYNGGER
jgi:hypothetical protein